jgi:hypothetical protein
MTETVSKDIFPNASKIIKQYIRLYDDEIVDN